MKSVGSYSFYSKDINSNKYNEFVKKASDIKDFKNNISLHINQNLIEISEKSKFDIIKLYGSLKNNQFTSSENIRGQELQKAVVDVLTSYENRINQVQSKINFKIQSKSKVTYYKRATANNKKGDAKSYDLILKSTKLTKIMTYLSRYGFVGVTSVLENRILTESNQDKKQFFIDCLDALNKFGEERLLKLALAKRTRILKRYSSPIVFKSLAYRSMIQTKENLIRNHKGFSNAVAVIQGMNNRKMVVPTSFNTKHHGHLNSFKSKDYLVCIEDSRIRFIQTKEVQRDYSVDNNEFIGVDTNVKHNLFSTSINEEIDFNRTMFNGYVSFLKKYDTNKAENKTKGELKQFNLWNRRIQGMLRQKASELVDLAIANNKDHIVMEDLSLFGKSMIRSEAFEGFKYSRLLRLLNLSSLNQLVRSVCQKKGIQLTLIHSHYTSQMCSKCGCISKQNRKSQEEFNCVVCADARNADLNSSINIHLIGHQEVLGGLTLMKDSSSWFVPKTLRKERIKDNLEDIVAQDAFQQNRLNLLDFICLE